MSYEDHGLVSLVNQIKQASENIAAANARADERISQIEKSINTRTNRRIDGIEQSVNELFRTTHRPGAAWETKGRQHF
jgi:methyl-accepting chemotaxis protein